MKYLNKQQNKSFNALLLYVNLQLEFGQIFVYTFALSMGESINAILSMYVRLQIITFCDYYDKDADTYVHLEDID